MIKIIEVYTQLQALEYAMFQSKTIHAISNPLHKTPKVDMGRFKNARLTRACNHIQSAKLDAISICGLFGIPLSAVPVVNLDVTKNNEPATEIQVVDSILAVIGRPISKDGLYSELINANANYTKAAEENVTVDNLSFKLLFVNLMSNLIEAGNLLSTLTDKTIYN